jgi:hypothetical protein
MVDVELEIMGEAVLRIVLFNEVRAKSKFQKEIDRDFDEGFADNRTVLVRASTTATLRLGKRIRSFAAASWPVAPPPITKTSLVMGSLISTGSCGTDLGFSTFRNKKPTNLEAVNIRGRQHKRDPLFEDQPMMQIRRRTAWKCALQ